MLYSRHGGRLVVPKPHVPDIYALGEELGAAVMRQALRVATGIKAGLGCDGVSLTQATGLEPVEGGVAPAADLRVAGLAAEILDALGAVVTTADQGVDGCVGVAVVGAGQVGAGMTGGRDRLGPAPAVLRQPPGWDGGCGGSGEDRCAGRLLAGRAVVRRARALRGTAGVQQRRPERRRAERGVTAADTR